MMGKKEYLHEYSERLLIDYNLPLWVFALIQWGALGYLAIAVLEGRGADPAAVKHIASVFRFGAYIVVGIVLLRPAVEIAATETLRKVSSE